MGITLKIGESILNFKKAPSKLTDMRELFRQIADVELSATKQRYIKEIDPDGKQWADPITLRRDGTARNNIPDPWGFFITNHYLPKGWRFWRRPDKILRDTSVLFNSIGSSYGNDYAIVGTNVSYGKNHQEGIGVKQRKFLGINKKTESNVKKIVNNYLKGILK